MEGVRKAILRIDCENGTKEAVSSPNEAARKILNHGSTDMAFGQEKCEIVVQYNPASIKYRAGISQNRSIKYERQNKEVYKITAITGESTADISFTLVFHSRFEGDPSVQEQMDLLFNMIRRSPEKQIEFLWSNIYVQGRLVSFSGVYDMFDSTGGPISGHMDITIETSTKVERTSKTLQNLDNKKQQDKLRKT